MSQMINYYEELKIDQNLRLDEINKELSQLESTWRRREINNPEKAAKMISLVMDARKVFKTDASRTEYDRQLSESRKSPEISDPNTKRRLTLEKWKAQALSYYNDHEYDLAKVAIEKTLSQIDSDADDAALFALAAEIYMENGNNSPALDYINKAIVFGSDISSYYITKGLIYDQLRSESQRNSDYAKAQDCLRRAREMYRQAISKAEGSGDNISKAKALGALAFSLYFQENPDKEEAERLALEAESVGGDLWGNAKCVLDDIAIIENARKEAVYSEATKLAVSWEISEIKKAVAKFETIIDYKDSALQIENLTAYIAEIENACKEAIYSGAMRLAASQEIWEIKQSISELKRIIDYKDSVLQIENLTDKIRIVCEEEERKKLEAENARKVATYFEALKLANSEEKPKILKAVSKFETIIDFKDSKQQINNLKTKIQLIEQKNVIIRKKIITALSVVLLVITTVVLSVYNIQRHKCGDNLTWSYDRNTNTLTIKGTGSMKNFDLYLAIAPWIDCKHEIKNVVVDEGVTTIGEYAFYEYRNLVSVSLPDSLIGIEDYAFCGDRNLWEIDLPENLRYISVSAFEGVNLKDVHIPASVRVIETSCFAYCGELESVTISEGVESPGYDAFIGCNSLKEIYIPHSVTSIKRLGCGKDCVIYYSGTMEEWNSLADLCDFYGSVECLDGKYSY